MKILYVGQLYCEGHTSTSLMRMEELRRLGIDIIPLEVLPYHLFAGKWLGAPFRRLKWGPPVSMLNREIVRLARNCRPDVLWIDKGIWVYPATLRAARGFGVRMMVHYTADPAIVFHRSRHFLAAIPEYDLIVTTKAYELSHYQRYGARQLLFQYPSYDRDIHRPPIPSAEEASQYDTDIIFAGCYAPGREKYLRPLVRAGINLTVWGSFWNKCTDAELKPHIRGRPLVGRDYALGLGCAKIGLGILSPLCPDRSTTRSLEIPACGTFLLAERTEEHRALFEEGKEAAFFSSEEELVKKARYYLDHAEERNSIAAAGRARCLASGYSSADRVKEILDRIHQLLDRAGADDCRRQGEPAQPALDSTAIG